MQIPVLLVVVVVLSLVTAQEEECLEFDCCQDDCCGPGTVWVDDDPLACCRCVPEIGAPGWIAPDDFAPECTDTLPCCEDTCCSDGTVYDEVLARCILEDGYTYSPTSSPTGETESPTRSPSAEDDCRCILRGKDPWFVNVNVQGFGFSLEGGGDNGKLPTERQQAYFDKNVVKRYNGRSSFRVKMFLCIDRFTNEPRDSWMAFEQVCYTSNGKPTADARKLRTTKIPIVSVDKDCDDLDGWMFQGEDWIRKEFQVDRNNNPIRIVAQSMKGEVDTNEAGDTATISWTSTHAFAKTGLGYARVVTGEFADETDNCMGP